jgi:hypothetical protein
VIVGTAYLVTFAARLTSTRLSMNTAIAVPLFDGHHALVCGTGVPATEASLRYTALGAILPMTLAILTVHASLLTGGFAVGGGALMLLAEERPSNHGL